MQLIKILILILAGGRRSISEQLMQKIMHPAILYFFFNEVQVEAYGHTLKICGACEHELQEAEFAASSSHSPKICFAEVS
jgi:hypothetical protein